MITFQNKGILDRRGITTFGLSAKPDMKEVNRDDMLLDTVVDFGERLLGLKQKGKVA